MRKTILGSLKRRGLSVALLVAVGVLGFSAVAAADTVGSIDFESYDTTGNINGQQGWSKTGPYDVEVVNTDRFGFGQALRISNAVTSGGFGDQTFSPGLTEPAGETARKHFESSFKIATTSDAGQPGLAISVSPDNGQGARMSYLRFVDRDRRRPCVLRPTARRIRSRRSIATLSRTSAHTIRFMINFKKGPPTTSRSSSTARRRSEARPGRTTTATAGEPVSPSARCCSARAALQLPPPVGNGFLIDNLTLTSS